MNSKQIIPFLVLASFALFSCKSNQQTESETVQVKTIELKDTTCTVEYEFPATIKGLQDVAIFPQVSGRITEIKVTEGQYVNKGDVLFVIDDVPYRAAYDAALAQVEVSKANLETAKLTFQSKQNLFDKNIISEYQLNLARNQVTTAEALLGQSNAALKNAENELSFTRVRTMGKGYIGSLPFKVGSLVGPDMGSPFTIVSDNSSVYADFSVTENTYLSTLATAKVTIDRLPLSLKTNLGERFPHEGYLHSLSGLISSTTGSIPARAIFPNPDLTLLSGGSCQVLLTAVRDHLIVVPRAAMKEIQDKLFVFIVKDGVLVQTAVNASRINASQWVIEPDEDGNMPLKAGDKITTTTNRLMDGMKVEVVK